jgi:hypothetical protein
MNRFRVYFSSAAIVSSLLLAAPRVAAADTVTLGDTFAVASEFGDQSVGTHFHSDSSGSFGNPAGKAEVGAFIAENVVGLSEFNLTGLNPNPASAVLTFNVFAAMGLFAPINDFPLNGTIDVLAYHGNNAEDITDYEASAIATIGSIKTSDLVVGSPVSFDITTLLASQIAGGFNSLGVRLQSAGPFTVNAGAWTFDNFSLTTSDGSTDVAPVPEPSTIGLLGIGLVMISRRWRA